MKQTVSEIESGEVEQKYKKLEENFREEQRMYNAADIIIALAQETIDLLIHWKIQLRMTP